MEDDIHVLEMPDSVESALHCTWLLAQRPATALPARRLAEFHGLPQAYLSKILKLLTRADVLRAVPGTGGGYRLARDPERITVLDILTAVQGDGPMFRPPPTAESGRACRYVQGRSPR
jgi:Rrf2 family protein